MVNQKRYGMLSKFSQLLFAAIVFGLLVACSPVDWPYYKPEVPGGIRTDKDAVEIRIRENISIWTRVVCYPRYKTVTDGHPKGFQHCHIVIYLFGPPSTALELENLQVVVQDISNAEIRYDAEVSDSTSVTMSPLRPGMGPGKGLYVKLKYKLPPKQFLLQIPDLKIEGKPHKIPEIIFTYTENIEWVPIIANW